jgi:WXG100 family type VII secretion target
VSHIGGELEQLQSLKSTFDAQGRTVQDLASALRTELGNTWWKGPAADRFRESWNGEFEPALRKLVAALQDAGVEVGRRRDALIQAGT